MYSYTNKKESHINMPMSAVSYCRADLNNIGACFKPQAGVSLIELMVSLVIGLVVSLAIYGVLTANEGRKRTTTSINDIDQAGTYALYQLDKLIRSAGSGFSAGRTPLQAGAFIRASEYTYGCPLRVASNGVQLIPASTFPTPFNSVAGANLVMAPVIIVNDAAGAGGDVLITMSGSGGLGESGTRFSSPATANQLNLINLAAMSASVNTGGVNKFDKLLLVAPPAGAISPCMLTQIAPGFTPLPGAGVVPLSGEFYSSTIAGTSVANYLETSVVLNFGKSPAFNMLGVGTNNTLFSYNLLSPANQNGSDSTSLPNPTIFVDSVYRMEAVYGINLPGNPDNVTLSWVQPTGVFSAANLMAGTTAANANLSRIVAVRVALIMTTALPEKANVSAATTTIFQSIGLSQVVNLNPLNRRYRVMESTISLRNAMLP